MTLIALPMILGPITEKATLPRASSAEVTMAMRSGRSRASNWRRVLPTSLVFPGGGPMPNMPGPPKPRPPVRRVGPSGARSFAALGLDDRAIGLAGRQHLLVGTDADDPARVEDDD